jgi:hypothetical protein
MESLAEDGFCHGMMANVGGLGSVLVPVGF